MRNKLKQLKKKAKIHIFEAVKGCNGAEKSIPPKGISIGPLLNVHTKFQLPSSIWRVVMKGTNSKIEKTQAKNYIFVTVKSCNETKKFEPSERRF